MSGEKIGPIRPDEVETLKKVMMPEEVFDSFNELIIRGFDGNRAVVQQDEVVQLMVKKGLNKSQIFKEHWLDIENLYRLEGWDVRYDKPGYNESGNSYFTFSRPKRGRERLNPFEL